jgi:Nucleotidyltransferase of unknown function (DUF6036)
MHLLEKLSDLPSPWRDFLVEHDADRELLRSISIDLIGGFVFKFIYGLPRPTQDIDFYTMEPRIDEYDRITGERSDLGKKHKVWLHGAAHTEMPSNYSSRKTEILAGEFIHLRLFIPDSYDLILSKLKRNSDKDQRDVIFVFEKEKLDLGVLSRRYDEELKDQSNEASFRLWAAMFQS